jgi:hypothetical protein
MQKAKDKLSLPFLPAYTALSWPSYNILFSWSACFIWFKLNSRNKNKNIGSI